VIRGARLGSARERGEGLRVGTVRRPPRGVKKNDYARRDYYDVWLPELAPSEKLFRWAVSQPWTDARWRRYRKAYEREMKTPAAQRLLDLLARLSHSANFSVGCYCEDEERCHRSILKRLLTEKNARVG
jgi:uncharacterized protein YeaO (DUF488 family)